VSGTSSGTGGVNLASRSGVKCRACSHAGEKPSASEDADPDSWFENWAPDGALFEDALHLGQWDQTLTLLWFDDEHLAAPAPKRKQWDEDAYRLRELDGILPWPSGKKRR
jgi:hypothetical protein